MKRELQSLTKGSSPLDCYLQKVKSLDFSLCGVGKPRDEDDFILCILQGLGSKFDLILVAINARNTFPPLESVIGKLRDFEIGISTTISTIALYTNRINNTSYSKRGRGTRSLKQPTDSLVTSFRGHSQWPSSCGN